MNNLSDPRGSAARSTEHTGPLLIRLDAVFRSQDYTGIVCWTGDGSLVWLEHDGRSPGQAFYVIIALDDWLSTDIDDGRPLPRS